MSAALRALSRLRRAFDANVEARSLYEREPIKFMPSEAELHEATIALARHAQHTQHTPHATQPAHRVGAD